MYPDFIQFTALVLDNATDHHDQDASKGSFSTLDTWGKAARSTRLVQQRRTHRCRFQRRGASQAPARSSSKGAHRILPARRAKAIRAGQQTWCVPFRFSLIVVARNLLLTARSLAHPPSPPADTPKEDEDDEGGVTRCVCDQAGELISLILLLTARCSHVIVVVRQQRPKRRTWDSWSNAKNAKSGNMAYAWVSSAKRTVQRNTTARCVGLTSTPYPRKSLIFCMHLYRILLIIPIINRTSELSKRSHKGQNKKAKSIHSSRTSRSTSPLPASETRKASGGAAAANKVPPKRRNTMNSRETDLEHVLDLSRKEAERAGLIPEGGGGSGDPGSAAGDDEPADVGPTGNGATSGRGRKRKRVGESESGETYVSSYLLHFVVRVMCVLFVAHSSFTAGLGKSALLVHPTRCARSMVQVRQLFLVAVRRAPTRADTAINRLLCQTPRRLRKAPRARRLAEGDEQEKRRSYQAWTQTVRLLVMVPICLVSDCADWNPLVFYLANRWQIEASKSIYISGQPTNREQHYPQRSLFLIQHQQQSCESQTLTCQAWKGR